MSARAERCVFLYVNDRYVGARITRWSLMRCMAELKRTFPFAKSRTATYEPRPEQAVADHPSSYRRALATRAEKQARTEDPGR